MQPNVIIQNSLMPPILNSGSILDAVLSLILIQSMTSITIEVSFNRTFASPIRVSVNPEPSRVAFVFVAKDTLHEKHLDAYYHVLKLCALFSAHERQDHSASGKLIRLESCLVGSGVSEPFSGEEHQPTQVPELGDEFDGLDWLMHMSAHISKLKWIRSSDSPLFRSKSPSLAPSIQDRIDAESPVLGLVNLDYAKIARRRRSLHNPEDTTNANYGRAWLFLESP